ncbi:uncharacterized protein JCM10292_001049 [Rhodotorula paludigena]|uniref:uncharacterized protein n=1 Tax=Rhodotorula paludigena TaxID=86838 RepID=UPI00317FB8A1
MLAKLAVALAAAAATPALAQLDSLRGTLPGSLHQCEATNLFFFDSSNARPLSVLFLPSDEVPDSLRTGTTTLDEAQQYSPLLALSDIETPDAAQYDFTLQVEAGAVFDVFAFLPDGTGKNLNLQRTVSTPLPGATSCLTSIPTSVSGSGSGATTEVSAQPTSTSGSASRSNTSAAASSSSQTSQTSSSATTGATNASGAASPSATPDSGSVRAHGLDASALFGWTIAAGGAALVMSGLLA